MEHISKLPQTLCFTELKALAQSPWAGRAQQRKCCADAQDPRTGEAVERDLWVTRKGATPAREGQLGLIPGSMGALLAPSVPEHWGRPARIMW